MRKDNGDIVIKELTVPLLVQDTILPIILLHIPEACKKIGISFDTYWDFSLATRRQFLINAVRLYKYPNEDQLSTIILKERKSALSKFLSWVSYTNEANLDSAHKKWFNLITRVFSKMTHQQTHSVWKRLELDHLVLVKYVRKDFLPMVMGELEEYGDDKTIAKEIEMRLKQA